MLIKSLFLLSKTSISILPFSARRSPQEAVYAAWLDLEKALRYVLVRIGDVPKDLSDVPEIAQYLYSNKYISESARNLLFGLRD
ncbi:hypothetical protein [Bacillus atrophaeus]|uniref:hypothetical protein n=1 Tax=Bacillus atrophaeus TaxID=1452 RepID=UPI002E1AABE0|nr:hypothetical protein [Bacillus atrophaeus]